MAASAPHTILLECQNPVHKEKIASGIIKPGYLIERDSADKVKPHATAAGNAFAIVAIEDDLQGNDIDDSYAVGDRVRYVHAARGDRLYMWLANGQSVAIGDKLESAGDGSLQKHVDDTNESATLTIIPASIVFEADEAVDMSDSSGADPSGRIKVTVL